MTTGKVSMARLLPLLILIAAALSTGCAPIPEQKIDFHTPVSATLSFATDQFDTLELQENEILLYLDRQLIGSVATVATNPKFDSAQAELKNGLWEAQQGSADPSLLPLPPGAFGFSTSANEYTTGFIAFVDQPHAWLIISIRNEWFKDVLSTLEIR